MIWRVNVWEWTCSAYVAEYDGNEKVCSTSTDSIAQHVLRGGSWYDYPFRLRSANRSYFTPDTRYNGLGFRLSRM
jgi:formylglycine-generating enzyme required for sulfatase activity